MSLAEELHIGMLICQLELNEQEQSVYVEIAHYAPRIAIKLLEELLAHKKPL
jgi:hypothetical protein